jgi:hypothetical protein
MAGLVPAIHVFFNTAMKGGWFYLMTNRRNGILYAPETKTWMAGTSPAMTVNEQRAGIRHARSRTGYPLLST